MMRRPLNPRSPRTPPGTRSQPCLASPVFNLHMALQLHLTSYHLDCPALTSVYSQPALT